ncbi:MAG: helix-turn-helix domain-containing protein [Anaeroplasmataceae bacterium]
MDKEKFGKLLAELRKEKGLTQQTFAELFNVSFQAVSKWETGESIPDISIMEQISRLYNISINDLINGNREKEALNDEMSIESNFTTAFLKKRMTKLIVSSLVLVLFLLFGLLPIMNFEIGIGSRVYVTSSLYDLIFSNNYEIGNFNLLIFFLSFVLSCIIGILSVFYKNKMKFLSFEEALLITSGFFFIFFLGSIQSNIVIGTLFLLFLVFVYIGCFLFCKNLSYNCMFINKKQSFFDLIGVYILQFEILMNVVMDIHNRYYGNKFVWCAFLIILYIISLFFYIITNYKDSLVYFIIRLSSFSLLGILCFLYSGDYGIILLTICFLIFNIVRFKRLDLYNKKVIENEN